MGKLIARLGQTLVADCVLDVPPVAFRSSMTKRRRGRRFSSLGKVGNDSRTLPTIKQQNGRGFATLPYVMSGHPGLRIVKHFDTVSGLISRRSLVYSPSTPIDEATFCFSPRQLCHSFRGIDFRELRNRAFARHLRHI